MTDNPQYDPSAGEKQETSDAGVGGAVFKEDESRIQGGSTQDSPKMAMHSTSTRAQIEGIVAQCRADVGAGNPAELARIIRQRLDQAKIDLDDAAIAELASA